MPTLTFYVTDDVAKKLEKVIAKRADAIGIKVSRGDIITPHIKKLYKQEFPNGNGHTKPAPVEDKWQAIHDAARHADEQDKENGI